MKIAVNQLVEIVLERTLGPAKYKSKVEDADDSELTLGVPISGGVIVPVRVGESISVIFYDKVAVYSFPATVLSADYNGLPVFKIKQPDQVSKIQRRKFVRVDASVPCTFKQGEEVKSTSSIDISGGGTRIINNTALEPGTELEITFNLTKTIVSCTGKVIRSIPRNSKEFEVCIQFLDTAPKSIDAIVAWVFQYQLELRKKGLM